MIRRGAFSRPARLSLLLAACLLLSACGGGGSGTIVVPLPNALLIITAVPNAVPETGMLVTYTITIINNGGDILTITALADDTYDLDTECPGAVGTFIDPSDTFTCVFASNVSGDPANSPLTNMVDATVTGAGGTLALSDSASVIILDELIAVFVPADSMPAGDTISMQAGVSSGNDFDIDIFVTDIADFFGAAFHVTWSAAAADYNGFDTTGSILNGMNPLFFSQLVSGQGELAVEASLQGAVAGLPNASGKLITLKFTAKTEVTGSPFTFTPISARLVEECPTAGGACNEIQGSLTWSEGVLDAD